VGRRQPIVARYLWQLPDASVSNDDPVIALTFDDGPYPGRTPPVLDALAESGAPATFFLVGARAEQCAQHVERIVRDGHSVGNHSWSHPRAEESDDATLEQEARRADELLRRLTGAPVRYFRPPYEQIDARRYAPLIPEDYRAVVNWSIDPRDWDKDAKAAEITAHVLDRLHPGAIVVLHHRPETVRALPMIVGGARGHGYELVALG
jgi:peptidoglycan/xylan/chitin deacetylase (PgdA/CDA1 family)